MPDAAVDGLIEATDRWAGERLDARAIDAAARLPEGLLEEMAEMGLFSLSIPASHGGLGLDLGDCCRVVAVIAEHDRAVGTTVGLHAGLGTRGLVRFGTPDQHDRWLPELASGKRIASFAATEPDAGSDLAAISTRIVRDGDGLRVDGAKAYVTNGGFAGLYTLLCDSPGFGKGRGQSLVLVAREDGGVTVGPEEHKLGLRGSSTTPVYFEGARVPHDRLVGVPGQGGEHAHHVLAWGRTVMASGCLGTARAAMALARRHLAERVQFGRPLSTQEVVQAQVGAALLQLDVLGALVAHTAAAPDEETLGERSLSAKILCSDGGWEVVDLALQLHGGLGYIEESGMPLLLRDARITRIFEGANDVLAWRLGTLVCVRPNLAPVLGPAQALVEGLAERRADLQRKWGMKLLRQPVLLHALGRRAAWVEAARSVVGTAQEDEAVAWIARRIAADDPVDAPRGARWLEAS